MSEKRITIEDILGDFGFRVVWSVSEYCSEVTAYEITGRDTENAPLFERKGAIGGPDYVESHDDAEEYLDGYVKWDGCTGLDMGQQYWCGPDDYKKHCALMRYIYERAFQLMGCEPDKAWVEETNF